VQIKLTYFEQQHEKYQVTIGEQQDGGQRLSRVAPGRDFRRASFGLHDEGRFFRTENADLIFQWEAVGKPCAASESTYSPYRVAQPNSSWESIT